MLCSPQVLTFNVLPSAHQAKTFVRIVEHIYVRNQDVKSRHLAGPIEKISHLWIGNDNLKFYIFSILLRIIKLSKLTILRNLIVNQLSIFVIRAVVGLAFAAIVTRIFFGRINPVYVAGLAIIMVGLAYFAEYLRRRKTT